MANSFFDTFLSRIMGVFGSSDSDADKKRLLKNISKELAKTNIKFYKYSAGEALPQTAKFFFDLYKVVGPAQSIFKNTANPNAFKSMVIDYYLSDEQKELEKMLSEEAILERAKKTPIKELSIEINQNLATYLNEFDETKISMIDSVYTKLSLLISFCTFDYYFFLKKFDSSIREDNFTSMPKFEAISAEYIVEDLKDFTTLAWELPFEADWSDVFDIIKKYRGVQVIAPNTWGKILQRLRKFRSMGIFEMIIQLISKDPGYQTVLVDKQERIINAQLDTMKKTIENTLQKIQSERQSSKIDEELNEIFGTTAILRLKYYSDVSNQSFEKKSIEGYKLCAPLNYLKAFLVDYFKKDVREFADLVLVRGQWVSSALATPLSDTYHELIAISEKITEFDNELGEEGALGIKIKTYLARADRDREAKNIVKTLVKDANKHAYDLLAVSTQNLVVVAKNTKNLLEDFERKPPEMIINWAELTHFADNPIKEQGINIYKKIFHFVTLMKFFLIKEEE